MIYKTIFRTVKKYYGGLFKDSTDFFKIKKKSARKKIAYEYSLHFVKTYFLEKDDLHIFNGIKDQDLANYFGRMIIPEYIGKWAGGYHWRKETDTFFDCIYHYSADVANRLYKSDIPKTPKPQNPKTPKPQNPKTPKPQNPKTPKPQNP